MKKSPLVSIIIPTYNSGKTIIQTIESVKNQTYTNYEIIVVDDGSTDGTVEILKTIKGIKLITQANQGVSAARNRGIEEAKGDYIAYLDSDDLWHPQKLEIQLKVAEPLKSFGMIATTYQKFYDVQINPQFPAFEVPPLESIEERSFYRFLKATTYLPSSVIIPKTVHNEIGKFDPELRIGEDHDLWLRIAYKYPVYCIPLDLMWYFIRKESLSRSIGLTGEINKIFMAEQWNPYKENTLDVDGKIDYKLYMKIFRKIVIDVGQWILKYRTTAEFQHKKLNAYQIFNLYWRRFEYSFGVYGNFIKYRIIFRNIIKYSFRKIQKYIIDEELVTKISTTKFS